VKLSRADLKAIAEREKRGVSFHEAAHAAIFRRYGGCGIAEVWRNTAQNVKDGQKAWLGTFKMFAEPGTMQMSDEVRKALRVLPPPDNWRVLVGIAGLVAEEILHGVTDADEIAVSIESDIGMGEASKTDMDLMGDDWNVSDVAEVLKLLLDMWPDIEREAASLPR
jgi:hypothetical protein